MSTAAAAILAHLDAVAAERARRARDPGLAQRALAIKAYQQARFRRTHADLLADPDHRDAALFFLEEIYGPQDFSERDAQFARIVPALARLFPTEIVETVRTLAAVHDLSEQLDGRMADRMPDGPLHAAGYARTWQAVGDPEGRERQIGLVLEVGHALARYTRKPLLRQTLRLMRGPAKAAGISALQAFLERGFDTFRALRDPSAFLERVAQRERALEAALFAAEPKLLPASGPDDPLLQLP